MNFGRTNLTLVTLIKKTYGFPLSFLGLDVDSAKRIVYSRKGYGRLSKTVEMSLAISNKKLEANGFMSFLSLYNVKRMLLI